jgi:hypothetical protein
MAFNPTTLASAAGIDQSINPKTGKPWTPEELLIAGKAQGTLSAEESAAMEQNAREQAAREAADKPWYKRAWDTVAPVVETGLDAGTLGLYSGAKEGLGFGESASLVDAGTDKLREALGIGNPITELGNAFGVDPGAVGEAFGGPGTMGGKGGGAAGGGGGLPDVSGIRAGGQQLFDAAMANYGRSLSPTEIRDPNAISVAPITSRDVSASGPAGVTSYTAAGPVTAPVVNAPNLGAASQVDLPEHLSAQLANYTPVQRATLDADPQAEIRGLQAGALEGLSELAAGRGPAADLERARLDAALARVSDEGFAAANASRGAGKGAARLQTALRGVDAGAQAAIAARGNALENQIAARGQQVGALQGVRAQDIDFAGQAASLEQQANTLDAQIEAARQLGNAQEVNRLTSQQAGLRQQAREFNAQAVNQRQQVQGAMTLQAEEGNAGRALTSGLDAAGRTDKAAEFGAGAANTSSLDYGRRQDAAATGNADRDVTAQTATGAQSLTAQTNTGAQQLEADRARSDASQGAFTATTQAQGTAGSTAAAGLGAQNDAINAQVAQKKAEDAARAAEEARKAQNREFLLEAGTKAATALSDERAKQDIEDIPGEKLDGFADAMAKKVKSWEYKPGEGPSGTHFGPMAQDLESTELGEALVREGDDGMKRVDMDSFANLMLAAVLRSRKRGR